MNPPAQDHHSQVPRIGPRVPVYENQHQKISRVRVDFEGSSKEIYVNDTGARAGMLFLHEEKVLLVRQFRYLTRDLAWEIPGGRVDDHESIEAAATREAFEETGLHCLSMSPLVSYIPGLDCSDNPTHIFLCTEFEEVLNSDDQHDPNEIADFSWLPFRECLQMIFEKRILDSMTITALLACHAARSLPDIDSVRK